MTSEVSTDPIDMIEGFVRRGQAAQEAVDGIIEGAAGPPEDEYLTVPVSGLRPSPLNPRRGFDEAALQELAASILEHGIIEPLIVRPSSARGPMPKGKLEPRWEIVAGERRFRAAKLAGLTTVPVRVKYLSDKQTIELQVVENLQRKDLDPLEEAAGYTQLHEKHGLGVDELATKVGKSKAYVYARLKLLALIPAAQDLVVDGTITAGHAILLARLKPEDQERAIDQDGGGLFDRERLGWTYRRIEDDRLGEDDAGDERVKPASVRELNAWIDENVRFDRSAPDPVFEPETSATLFQAQEEAEKIVPITYEHYVRPEAKADERTYGPQSWKRADGKDKSKTCERSVTGVVVVGPGRGEAFKICIDKERCKTHWSAEQKAKAKRAKAGGDTTTHRDAWKREEEKRRAQQAKEEAERARWRKATPAILEAVAERLKKVPNAGPGGLLGQIVLRALDPYRVAAAQRKLFPQGKTAEDLVRYLAFLQVAAELNTWNVDRTFPARAKALGISFEVETILNEVAPPREGQRPKPAKKSQKKR